MQFSSTFSRFVGFALFMLSLGMLAHAAPTLDSRDVCIGGLIGCETGNPIVLALTKLKDRVELNVGHIMSAVEDGVNPIQFVAAILTLITDTTKALSITILEAADTTDNQIAKLARLLAEIIKTIVKGLFTSSGKIGLPDFSLLGGLIDQGLVDLLAGFTPVASIAPVAGTTPVVDLFQLIASFLMTGLSTLNGVNLPQVGLKGTAKILGLD